MQNSKDPYDAFRVKEPLNRTEIPTPIFEKNPEYVELYWTAWELAWKHVLYQKEAPEPFHMDEAMNPWTIWIWDTCFMALFCRYAPKIFPGIQSLNNFYYILHENVKSPLKIHFADNPPLFAWVEWEYYQLTGDINRLNWVLKEKKYLQKHFEFIENSKPGKRLSSVHCLLYTKRFPVGYRWRGNTSGMDNSPRGRNKLNNTKLNTRGQIMWNCILWVDLLAQQTLAAENIYKIAEILKEREISIAYKKIYDQNLHILDTYYWDPKDNFYYDIYNKNIEILKQWSSSDKERMFNKVKTPASYWAMLCGACDSNQAQSMVEHIINEKEFGGQFPLPSLARSDREFDPQGRYWRGGIWLPTSYITIKALERYNFYSIADEIAEKTVNLMLQTYKEFEPHTIWECYSPTEYKPSTLKRNETYVREDFCGWSALGPISLFIENILGFHKISAPDNMIQWDIHNEQRHGIENLHFGQNITDLIFDHNEILVKSQKSYQLNLLYKNQKWSFQVDSGENRFRLDI